MRAAVDAMRTLVQISYLHASSSLELTYLVINGLNLGELVGPSPELARSLANASALAGLMNLQRRADRYARRAVEMAEQTEHSPASAYVWNVIAIMHAGRPYNSATRPATMPRMPACQSSLARTSAGSF